MNIAGCDFVCENKDCDKYSQKITLYHKWPLVDIDFLIENISDIALIKKLNQDKAYGRKLGKMFFPANIDYEIKGYGFSGWCPTETRIYSYDVLEEDLTEEYVIPSLSEKNNPIYSFFDCIDTGIKCPFCEKNLTAYRWLTKCN